MKKMTSLVWSVVLGAFAFISTSCTSTNNSTERTSVTPATTTTQSAVTTQEATTTKASATTTTTTATSGSKMEKSNTTPAGTTKKVTHKEESTTASELTTTKKAELQPSATVPTTTTELTTTEKITEETTTSIEETTTATTMEETVEPKKVVLDVTNISLYPELPMGSAIVSAAIGLNYYGFNCNKSSLMKYITFMNSDDEYGLWGNPNELFIGSPEDNNFGYCSSTVIKNAITSFLNDNGGSAYQVVDITGTSFTDLYAEIDNNNPVIIWASNGMMDMIHPFPISLQNGETFEYPSNYECICLVGYDTEMNTIYVCDPAYNDNIVEFKKSSAELVYNQLGKQALVIHKK